MAWPTTPNAIPRETRVVTPIPTTPPDASGLPLWVRAAPLKLHVFAAANFQIVAGLPLWVRAAPLKRAPRSAA